MMTVTEMREALQALEADGHGAAEVVTRTGMSIHGNWHDLLSGTGHVGLVRHLNMRPLEDGPQVAVEVA
jgi:hypothetical protein